MTLNPSTLRLSVQRGDHGQIYYTDSNMGKISEMSKTPKS